MGLTGGLLDVVGLADCFYGIQTAQADDTILDKYSRIRGKSIGKLLIRSLRGTSREFGIRAKKLSRMTLYFRL